jgi:hypothetical protein
MNTTMTMDFTIHFERTDKGSRKEIRDGEAPEPAPARLPRVTRLMALSLRFELLVHEGQVRDYAELARLGHVTRARMSQVMSLLWLAPDIQEALLFLPRIERGRDPVVLRDLLPIAAELDWRKQRRRWRRLRSGPQ